MVDGGAIAGAIAFGNEPVPLNGETTRIVADMFFPLLFVVFGLVSAALIATVAVLALRDESVPRWIGYTGWIGALGALTGVFFIPFVVALLWYLAIAIAGLTRASTAPGLPADAGIALRNYPGPACLAGVDAPKQTLPCCGGGSRHRSA